MRKHKIGLIGAGMIAEQHASGLLKTGRVDITWVARQNGALLQEFQEKFGIPNGTTAYQDILNDPEVDAVVISTPPADHFQMFVDAMKAGKHVLIEKPMAIHLNEVDRMVEVRQEYPDLKVLDCSCRHTSLQPKFGFVKNLIDTGVLGEIYFIHHNSVAMQNRPGIEFHPSAKWFLDKAQAGGGPIMDWGVYDLSFHLGLLSNKPELVKVMPFFIRQGLDKKDPGTAIYDVEEHFAVRLQFDSGLEYYWERAAHANMMVPNETRIYGSKAGVKLSFCTWDSNKIELFGVANDGKGEAYSQTFEVDASSQNDGDELSKHFVEVLDGVAEPMMPLELAAKHLRILQKIYG